MTAIPPLSRFVANSFSSPRELRAALQFSTCDDRAGS